ncbi:hypothetical protein HYS31_00850 [Candidatus Woesearchaeota archaeon]|nr:hypothetical protein [Candidatus Woesearchaeota archaeon]
MLRKFGIWLVKNLIILLLVALVFSGISLDLPEMAKGIFRDIFAYASPEAQRDVVQRLAGACSLDEKSLEEAQKDMTRRSMPLDFTKIVALCSDYKSGKINGNQFFYSVIGTAIPEKFELPDSGAIQKYTAALDYLNNNKIIYITLMIVLLLFLFFLAGTLEQFTAILTDICMSMGILIILPYAVIIIYEKFVGIDTTPILATVLGESSSLSIKAIVSVILLLILRTYTSFILLIGIFFLGVGMFGKVFKYYRSHRAKTEKQRKEAKAEEFAEKERSRDRSTKEILDELEDIQRKKLKEK